MGVVSSALGVREASWRRRNESGSLRIICHIERRECSRQKSQHPQRPGVKITAGPEPGSPQI